MQFQSKTRFFFILFYCLILLPTFSYATPPELDPNSEHVLEVVLDDSTIMSQGMIIYPVSRHWFVPLGELSESLGIAIQSFVAQSTAEGFILTPSRGFHLDLKHCTVHYGNKYETFPCDEAVVFHEDIYVDLELIEKWLPFKARVDSGASQMIITPKEKLPEQLRKEREQLADRSKGISSDYDPGFPRVQTPHLLLDGPFIDEQLSFSRRFNGDSGFNSFTHDTQIGGEVLGLDTYSFFNGDERQLNTWRLNFSRKEPKGTLMGPLALKEVQFFHVDMPSLPLISTLKLARGFLVSNFPFETPTSFANQDFQGPLISGWEVVLYWNEILLDRRLGDSTGRYIFKNVPLSYGTNLFRLAFYGPRGERRDEYRNFTIGPGLLPVGKTYYRTALGVMDDSRQRVTVQFAKNLTRSFTLTSGVLYDNSAGSTPLSSFGYIGLTGVNELFLFSSTCAFSTSGGQSCEWGEQMGIGRASLGGKYTRLFNYTSEVLNYSLGSIQTDQITANFLYPVPVYPMIITSFEFIKKNFQNQIADSNLKNRLAMNAGFLSLANELSYNFNDLPVLGKWEVNYTPTLSRFILATEYNSKNITAVELGMQYSLTDSYSAEGRIRHPLDGNKPTLNLSLTRLFKNFSLGTRITYVDTQNFTTDVNLAFSLARDPETNDLHVLRSPTSLQGSASANVFVDNNRNGLMDLGEIPLPKAQLQVNQRELKEKTDEKGHLFIPYLRPYTPTDIELSLATLEDPFLRPANLGLRILPRAGKTTPINFPLVVVGQIDGSVLIRDAKGEHAKRGVQLELFDEKGNTVAKTKTDMGGFYVFDGVFPGSYSLKISDSQLKQWNVQSIPIQRNATIAPEGSFESSLDFSLQP